VCTHREDKPVDPRDCGMKGCNLVDRVLIIIFGMVERILIGLKSEIKVTVVDLGVSEI
jgi:hypothetical protein